MGLRDARSRRQGWERRHPIWSRTTSPGFRTRISVLAVFRLGKGSPERCVRGASTGNLARRQGALDSIRPVTRVEFLNGFPKDLPADRVRRPKLTLRKTVATQTLLVPLTEAVIRKLPAVSGADDQTRLPRSAFLVKAGAPRISTRIACHTALVRHFWQPFRR